MSTFRCQHCGVQIVTELPKPAKDKRTCKNCVHKAPKPKPAKKKATKRRR